MMSKTSKEKLDKFLTSDDPALRKMGLSLTSNLSIPESCYADLCALSFFDPETSNRKNALKIVSKLLPNLVKELKTFWKNRQPTTRNESKAFDPYQINYDWDAEDFMDNISKETKNQLFDSRQMSISSYKLLKGKNPIIPEPYEGLITGFVKFLGKEKYLPAKEILIEIHNIYGDKGPGREVIALASVFKGEDMEDLLISNLIQKEYFAMNSIDEGAKQLIKIGTKRISQKIIGNLSTNKIQLLYSNPKLRDVIWTLGKIGHSEALEPLINLCRTELISSKERWETLSASAFSVAELSEKNKDIALEYLYELLDNTSEWVVESAIYGLGMISDENSIPHIEKIIGGNRGRGHSRSFGWGHYMPLTKKTALNTLKFIKKGEKLPPVKSPWPLHHNWSKNEIWMD